MTKRKSRKSSTKTDHTTEKRLETVVETLTPKDKIGTIDNTIEAKLGTEGVAASKTRSPHKTNMTEPIERGQHHTAITSSMDEDFHQEVMIPSLLCFKGRRSSKGASSSSAQAMKVRSEVVSAEVGSAAASAVVDFSDTKGIDSAPALLHFQGSSKVVSDNRGSDPSALDSRSHVSSSFTSRRPPEMEEIEIVSPKMRFQGRGKTAMMCETGERELFGDRAAKFLLVQMLCLYDFIASYRWSYLRLIFLICVLKVVFVFILPLG